MGMGGSELVRGVVDQDAKGGCISEYIGLEWSGSE